MNHRMRLISLILLFSIFQQPAFAASSGFIRNMPKLHRDPERPDAMIWERTDFKRSAYTKVMMAPLKIYISPNSKYKDLDAKEQSVLSDEFREAVGKALAPEIPMVGKAGPGVLLIRSAVTNVRLEQKKRGILGYTPIGFVVTSIQNAAGQRISLQNAVLEIEMLDSVTKKRLGVLVDKAPAPPRSEKLSWDSIRKTFAFYAERFKARMQAEK